MSYTLRGRLETRLVAAAPALLLAFALHTWWAVELVAAMLLLGLALDAVIYHGLLAYQPGWAALPLGALELALLYGVMRAVPIHAPLATALALYVVAWVSAQLLGHAVFPRLRLSYGEDGGELGRVGAAAATAVVLAGLTGLGFDVGTRPPTVHLHGVVQGPLVIRSPRTIVGGVVRGGIVIRSNKVTLRDVTVVGGENGVDVDDATHVVLDGVQVVGSSLDAIHVRRSDVMIDDCRISSPSGAWVQGIDISFAAHRGMSMVEHCTISGVREGIVTHFSQVDVMHNDVSDTTLRAITIGEMSMSAVRDNSISGALGVGVYCVDSSECTIEDNTIARTRVDPSGDPMRAGVAIESHYNAHAFVRDNVVAASPGGVQAFGSGVVTRR
jgi:parallel beta-helix repeat protein